jgi:hypothetical protein
MPLTPAGTGSAVIAAEAVRSWSENVAISAVVLDKSGGMVADSLDRGQKGKALKPRTCSPCSVELLLVDGVYHHPLVSCMNAGKRMDFGDRDKQEGKVHD